MGQKPVYLFYSYAHEDEKLRDELAGHLKIMERRGVIHAWHDREILPGKSWDETIDKNLKNADVILLLISSDFINSNYIWGYELKTAMNRHANQSASVIPVMLRAVDIEGAPFAALQGLPTDLKPVTSWLNRDEAWTNVAKGIRRVVEEIHVKAQTNLPESFKINNYFSGITKSIKGKLKNFLPKNLIMQTSRSTHDRKIDLTKDSLLSRVVAEFESSIEHAAKLRKSGEINLENIDKSALELIDNQIKNACYGWMTSHKITDLK